MVKTPPVMPAYRLIKRKICTRLGREWQPGSRLPTIEELARQLGTGHRNTHRAVRELVSEGLLLSVPRRGTFVTRKLTAAQLRAALQKQHRRDDLLLGGERLHGRRIRFLQGAPHPDGLVQRMVEAMQASLREWGCEFSTDVFSHYKNRAGRYQIDVDEPDVDAVVIMNPDSTPRIVVARDQPVVFLNTALETPISRPNGFDVVTLDQEQGGWLVGDLAHNRGHSLAVFVGRRDSADNGSFDQTSRTRLQGFEMGFGTAVSDEHRFLCKAYDEADGAATVAKYLALEPRPRFIFAASDEIAVGFLLGAVAHGLAPSRDFDLVGFDGQERARQVGGGPLTTVGAPAEAMGEQAAALLAERLENPDRPVRRVALGCMLLTGVTVR